VAGITVEALELGRAAFERHAWQEAFDRFSEADAGGALTADDLESFATAAYFLARPDLDIDLTERAFQRREQDGNHVRAAFLAILIARKYWYAGKASIASGWVRRAQRMLGDTGETYAHGYLAIAGSEAARAAGDTTAATTLAERALAIAETAGDSDLLAHARANLGELKIASGETAEGVALLEEATVAAVNGELTPFTGGVTACRMIGVCRDLTDYRRASEWIEATERYCQRQSLEGFPGICRLHRAEVAEVAGAWDQAETELQRAMTELQPFDPPPLGDGFYALGDIRRRRGDVEGAEAALREAHARGRTPQPALALIRLAQGNVRAAQAAIDAAVADHTWDRWARARLLPAQVEILLAAGEVRRARRAADELAEIVGSYPSAALVAGSATALGRVALAEGDAPSAANSLRAAIRGWREVGAPYEVARARVVLARALRALDDEDGADLELRAAIEAFQQLGAVVDGAAAEAEEREAAARRERPRTTRQAFMFTDIVGSTTLAEALGDEAWLGVLRWHDETLRSLVARGGGRVVSSTGDGVFAAFPAAGDALSTAVAIQRALRDHRADSGFAPAVRIGVHAGEATVRGDDFSGLAVHVAARVGALAGANQILATTSTLEEAGTVAADEARDVEVKGVSAPVQVAPVDWA
jgi:class 3 adenylate cyclase